MWSRIRLDVAWSDLAWTLLHCALPARRSSAQERLERRWCPEGGALACHSLRSGYDLLLAALDWPAGSEVLYSALNVKGMVKIAEAHGLSPVPVDLELDTMGPRLSDVERAVGERSRAIVVAHLFGTRLDLDPLIAVARRHGLLVIEDCAQAFAGDGFRGHPEADVSMFSFGPLKTATALGGALLQVRDPALLARMRALQATHPVQTRRSLALRALKFAALKALTWPWLFGSVVRGFRRLGRDYEDPIADSVRGVARLGSARKLRRRPCAPQLALLERRLRRFDGSGLDARRRAGEALRDRTRGLVPLPAQANPRHDYWVFPILVERPAEAIAALRSAGFDASGLPRSRTVAVPVDRPELDPATARDTLARLVVLPCYPEMPDSERDRLVEVLARIVAATSGEPAHSHSRFQCA